MFTYQTILLLRIRHRSSLRSCLHLSFTFKCKLAPRFFEHIGRCRLGADHLTLEGGGGVGDFEKKFPASACGKKKIACSTNVKEKNSCTAVKKYPTHQVARKKNLADHKSPTHPLKSQMVGPLSSKVWNILHFCLLSLFIM